MFGLAVVVGPGSSGNSAAAHRTASPSATTPATPKTPPAQDSAQAKLEAETTSAANPVPNSVRADQQPSWNVKPKIVQYLGYQIQVPSSWPVYNLATDPSKCVLFSTHAVYLGTPGSGQDCPASAIGHTEALLLQPVSSASLSSEAITVGGGEAALSQDTALPADTTDTTHEFQVDVEKAGVLVTAAYGPNEAGLRAILAGAKISSTSAHVSGSSSSGSGSSAKSTASARSTASAKPATAGQSLSVSASSATAESAATATAAKSAATATSATTASASAASASSAASSAAITGMVGSGLAFDTCTAPSTSTMTRWLASPYRVMGTYLGGMNWACSYGNFTASWVSQTAAEGWRFAPLWVGRQASCSTIPGVSKINLSDATAEGESEARTAVASAKHFGFAKGSPIYFDMEGYDAGGSCGRGVVNFLGGWTRELHTYGYVSGVYTSAASGVRDLVAAYSSSGSSRPDDIWAADWNGKPVLTDSFLPGTYWSNHQRLHQYAGAHDEKWGGATLDIDSDAADGKVAGRVSVANSSAPAESATPSELTAAPGHTAKVTLTLHSQSASSVDVQWHAGVPKGMSATPGSGTVDLTAKGVYSATVTLTPATSLAQGRYVVPITVSSGSHTVAEAYVLLTVVRSGGSLPTHSPIVLYAADKYDMATAAQVRRSLALPATNVTGTFKQAWKDAAAGKDLVIAVGEPAADALYFNVCGWTDPAGWPAGSTPFYYPGYPVRSSIGRNYFELASTPTTANTTKLLTELTQYALTGSLPGSGPTAIAATPPALKCEGSAKIPVP
ncbi:MAG TPA: DUF1906 domain-containing protein [Streptosporangiaceae bacterium]